MRDGGLVYEHWRSRLHPEDLERTEASLRAAVEGRGNYDVIFRVVLPDGGIRFIQAGAQVERDADGNPLQVTGINIDITSDQQLQARLREAKEQADAASAAKSSFLANMSHEIRTPMNAVLGMLQLARQTDLNERQRDYLDKASSAATSLLGLLNDILDYSKIEAGKLVLEMLPFELEPLMQDLAVVLSGNQGDKDVEVIFDIDPELPSAVVGDRLRLQQILINLAGNALKFTARGHVLVSLRRLAHDAHLVRLRVLVADTGIGISAEQQQRIFEGFTQAEASTSRRFGGTGLGLFICKRLVDLMGGELRVESAPGSGSRFWFDLDLDVAHDQPLRAACPGAGEPLRLLVADDNLVAGELLDRYSERLVVGLGTLIVALALCASLWATDYLTILLFLVVVGAGYSTAQPGGSKSVSRWFAKTQLGFAMGIRQAGLPLGGALSAALLPYLAGIYGWRSAFLAGGLVAFLGALAFMLFYRTPPDAPALGANPAERDLGAVVKSRLAMITDPAMKNIVCSGVALISVQYGILVFTVLYLHETLEIGIGMAATLLFVAQGSGVAGRILLAAWSDRCRAGRYFPVMVCLGAVILGLLALVLLPLQSPLGMGLVVAWLGFFGFGWYGPWVAYVADTAPVGKTGFALGLAMAINQLAIVLAPPALGLLKDFSHSFVPGWLALCLMAAVALVVTAWSGRGLPTALPQKH